MSKSLKVHLFCAAAAEASEASFSWCCVSVGIAMEEEINPTKKESKREREKEANIFDRSKSNW
jgi:hypothetical protein